MTLWGCAGGWCSKTERADSATDERIAPVLVEPTTTVTCANDCTRPTQHAQHASVPQAISIAFTFEYRDDNLHVNLRLSTHTTIRSRYNVARPGLDLFQQSSCNCHSLLLSSMARNIQDSELYRYANKVRGQTVVITGMISTY